MTVSPSDRPASLSDVRSVYLALADASEATRRQVSATTELVAVLRRLDASVIGLSANVIALTEAIDRLTLHLTAEPQAAVHPTEPAPPPEDATQ